MFLLFLPVVFSWNSVATDAIQDALPPFHLSQNDIIQSSLAHFLPGRPMPINTTTYIDKGENILRVPNITRFEDKKKPIKKTPRRTIQKIIKKSKVKRKYSPVVTQATQTKEQFEFDIYAKEELLQKNNVSTTQSNQKKQRKWNKLPRYPMPFQKMNMNSQKNMNVFRRNKRSEDRKDLFILKDLDELQFLSKNKDYDVVNAHLQKHW